MKNYYKISQDALGQDAKIPILKLGDSGEVFYEIALRMVNKIAENNALNQPTAFIVPVGPVGQYPIFVRLVNERKLSLYNTWFFNMDEYLDADKNWVSMEDPLSFRGFMQSQVFGRIEAGLRPPEDHRVFPDPQDPSKLDSLLFSLGGPDIAFGGLGLNGHLAFNEPQPSFSLEEFSNLSSRVLEISLETRAMNSVGNLKGALEDMPTHCVTIGMKQILSSKQIVIGVFRDWHRAVLRRAAYGELSTVFPATLLQNHPDAMIISNNVASSL